MLFDAQNEDENQSGTEIGNLSKDEDDLWFLYELLIVCLYCKQSVRFILLVINWK